MAQPHLSNDEFFTQLASLIEKTQKAGHGAVHLSQKRLTYGSSAATAAAADSPAAPSTASDPSEPLPLLIRATDGKGWTREGKGRERVRRDKVKIGTVVAPDAIEAFFARYADVCRAGMLSLKKRDRSKRKKDKGKKKKAGGAAAAAA